MPPTVVTVPEVPSRWNSGRYAAEPAASSNGARRSLTSSTMASKAIRVTSTPPCRSASVTTPTGSESQARMRFIGSASGLAPLPSSQAISVEPPPMSKMTTEWARGSASAAQPVTAR